MRITIEYHFSKTLNNQRFEMISSIENNEK
jgi:hypothetical protein